MANMHIVTGYAGTAHITAADHGALNAAVFGSGEYVLTKGNQFAASIITSNTVRVFDGDIMMQGRYARLNEGKYVDLTIENGVPNELRNDLIVARYTKNTNTGVEEINLVVIKGASVAEKPVDPEYTSGSIIEGGAILNDMPLYRIPLEGLTVGAPVRLFSVKKVGDAVEDVIYPGIVDAHLHNSSNYIGITLYERPTDKMFLTFVAPYLTGTTFDSIYPVSLTIKYPGADGSETSEMFWLHDGRRQAPPDGAIRPGDVITVLLTRDSDGQGRAYLLNSRISRTTLDEIENRNWRTVTFIPYDGSRHTLAEAQAGVMLELPAEMDLVNYNYEYEILALGLTVTGQTAYNTNVPNITLHMDGVVKNRISLSLENTEEMENGTIPECDNHGFYLQQGIISLTQRRFWVSGKFWGINSMKEGYAVSRGYSDISEGYEYYSHIRLNTYVADTTQTYGLIFRYRPIPKE